ncbi:molybdopterin molybdotransferase MoeA [Desulfobacula phenolica]|uniref:Molybdopterin molybdenumtransferase n=1 Tax=Desulfobacula phenolica TaxID=90732 RepID=A0A1H2IZ07_9BACT|nr:gephyrin-like molybdotransferase Glp [Desulfobacula phenolica]SDU49038.1 molybdopterin molybdotransferase [Desulfobacula phenolica]
MIDIKKVQKQILEATPVLGRESVPILDAVRRVLVQDIIVAEDLPASDISAMDGYAVSHTSLRSVSKQNPAYFKIIGESPAGKPCGAIVKEGEAVRIMTGGLVPEGADTVVKVEDTIEEDGYVICSIDPGCGEGIRFKGESLQTGEVVLHAGDVISPLEVGALASLRRAYVYVHRKPLVAILSTGDELSDFHEPPSPSKAMCSNLYALAAQVVEAGAKPLCIGIVQDDLEELQSQLYEALHADVIITSGGTSKGKYDLVHKAFSSLDMKMKFTNIFDKPGKPTVFGTIRKKLVFGLPGNPSATMLSFEQFIRPALLKMMGFQNISNASHNTNDPFSLIDSFNYGQGGNKEHHRAPQIPLGKTLSGNDNKYLKKKKQVCNTMPGCLKIVGR